MRLRDHIEQEDVFELFQDSGIDVNLGYLTQSRDRYIN